MHTLPQTVRIAAHRRVLRRGAHGRWIGLDPGTAVVVEALPPPLATLLDELGGPVRSADAVRRAEAAGAERGAAEQLLAELLAAGVVVDAGGPARAARRRAEAAVHVTGAGPLASRVAEGLAQAGVGTVEAAGRVPAADATDRRGAAAALDAEGGPLAGAPPRAFGGVRAGRPAQPDLVVLADALVPDPAVVDRLRSRGLAHLVVRLRDGAGIIGPAVLPGRTPCLTCLDLTRAERDPRWPEVSAQLVGVPGGGDPATAAATAALAVVQCLALLDGTGPAPPVLGATLEVDLRAGTVTRRSWPARAGCRCGAHRSGATRATCAPGADRGTITV